MLPSLLVCRCGNLARSRITAIAGTTLAFKSTGSAQEQMDKFWERNKKNNRPMSPHLTIYKPQLTSMLSITHRGTGIALAGATSIFAVSTAIYSGDVDQIQQLAHNLHQTYLGSGFLLGLKFMLAWPLTFHTVNGIRHLVWDLAKGLSLREVYLGGWSVLGASIVFAALMSILW